MGRQRDAAVTGEGARKSQRDCAIIPAVVANDQANSDQRRKLQENDDCQAAARHERATLTRASGGVRPPPARGSL